MKKVSMTQKEFVDYISNRLCVDIPLSITVCPAGESVNALDLLAKDAISPSYRYESHEHTTLLSGGAVTLRETRVEYDFDRIHTIKSLEFTVLESDYILIVLSEELRTRVLIQKFIESDFLKNYDVVSSDGTHHYEWGTFGKTTLISDWGNDE